MSIVKLNNRGVRSATAFGSITGLGSMTFIKKLTASSSSTLSFVDGASSVVLDNTYKEYLFTFNNIHPATDAVHLQRNFSADSGSNYNVTKTTTNFQAFHMENAGEAGVAYQGSLDMAQGTGAVAISNSLSNDNDGSTGGYLHLYNPSDTTFVKHYMATFNATQYQDYSTNYYVAGYGNTTSAIDAVQFQMSSGNIDAGDICLYGIN